MIYIKTVICAFNARYSHSSLAIRYIKAYNSNEDIVIKEYSINDNLYSAYADLLREKADIYCFSLYIWNVEITCKAAQMIKKALPEVKIVLGGPECSYCAEEYLKKYDFLDYIVSGEGEVATGKLIKSLKNNENTKIKGVISREYNGGLANCVDLGTIAFPYTDESLNELKNKIIYFETSRGCPFKCSYCLSSIEKGIRYLPMEYVKNGFDTFFKNNVPLVKLIDRTFNADPKRACEIVRYIIENSKCTSVHFEIDPVIMTDELADLLISAPKGLFQLEIGIQSANKDTLKAVNRNDNLEAVARNITKLKSTGNMHIHLDLIAGLPFEDYNSFGKSFDFVYSLKPDMLQLGFLKMLYGTPIRENGDIIFADFPPYEVISTKWLTADEICRLKLIDEAVDKINNSGAFKNTLKKLTDNNAFSVFEKISDIFDTKETLSRFDIYEKLYELFGNSIKKELLLDFMYSSKGRAMPKFADTKYPEGFKKVCARFLKSQNINSDVRIEPIGDEIYMIDYKSGKLCNISKEFKEIC